MKKINEMTNQEFASRLRTLAELYDKHPELPRGYGLTIYANTKREVQRVLKMIGGKWTKEITGMNNYPNLQFTHTITGIVVQVPRDLVCRKIVSYDCDPIMSPEEEAELLTEV